jgi:hypothetical protein
MEKTLEKNKKAHTWRQGENFRQKTRIFGKVLSLAHPERTRRKPWTKTKRFSKMISVAHPG